MIRVLFVCTGNVHRSALAERLLAARLPRGSAVRPESAGTQAWPRSGMERSTRAVLERLGGDGSGFVSRPLTARLVLGSALVLGLAREHREAAVRLAPSAMRRCFTLKEFVRLAGGETGRDGQRPDGGGDLAAVVAAAAARRGYATPVPPEETDVADPWGRHSAELDRCAREIDDMMGSLVRLCAFHR
ncbi:arsenate reductase/protein-tyrosine-phosphatase family protein [Streptomyces afghaniensis]|uniref:arsenate reductase/protein-tyrosine-phosphatase family protein n=1 Tax=Streptomyces afghaniensis TaxID=66865 RepID=UPI002787A5BD|nr:low molecular weight phosphatase family protein [Streptomyces afghaniensis]MDQ1020547.1 protein-tyrosine phosphatase [Streptomyces afghaniensis]